MKRLLVFMFLFPTIAFGQNNIEVNTNISAKTTSEFITDGDGITYIGNSRYKIQKTAATDVGSFAKQRKKAEKRIEAFATEQGFTYKILNEEKTRLAVKGTYGISRCTTTFQLIDKNGNIRISDLDVEKEKEASKKKLFDLKKLKDEGIITQEEYDKAAAPHKKILLGL